MADDVQIPWWDIDPIFQPSWPNPPRRPRPTPAPPRAAPPRPAPAPYVPQRGVLFDNARFYTPPQAGDAAAIVRGTYGQTTTQAQTLLTTAAALRDTRLPTGRNAAGALVSVVIGALSWVFGRGGPEPDTRTGGPRRVVPSFDPFTIRLPSGRRLRVDPRKSGASVPGIARPVDTRKTAPEPRTAPERVPGRGTRGLTKPPPFAVPTSYPVGDPRATWTPKTTSRQGQKTTTKTAALPGIAGPVTTSPSSPTSSTSSSATTFTPPKWWTDFAEPIIKMLQKPASTPRVKSPKPAPASAPAVAQPAVSTITDPLTGLNTSMLPFLGGSPATRTRECECAKPRKKGKKGCVNPVISRITRDGIRTTKTRIVCPPSKPKSR